jgi:iron complex transport system substrate-binding protein
MMGSGLRFVLLMMCVLAVSAHAAEPAHRIVSLAPSLTELAFTAGAGERLVGTVEFSDHPAAAKQIPRIGDAFRVDFERVLALHPDLVLAWQGGTPERVIARLRELGLEVAVIETFRLADIPAAVRSIGTLTGLEGTARRMAERFERDIRALRQEYAGRARLRVFLQVNSAPLYTVNGRQIMSEVLEVCGGRNVFANLNQLAPEIGIEAVLAANPEVIIAVETNADAAAMWGRWQQVTAVRSGNLYTLSPDDLARPTTRLLSGAQQLCRTLQRARERSTAR